MSDELSKKKKSYEKKITTKYGSYKYNHDFVFNITIGDLVDLLGAETACKLIRFYGGSNLYIPSHKTFRRRLRNTKLRHEYKTRIENGGAVAQVIDHLAKTYRMNPVMISKIVGRWYASEEEYLKRHRAEVLQDEKTAEVVALNLAVFQEYNLI